MMGIIQTEDIQIAFKEKMQNYSNSYVHSGLMQIFYFPKQQPSAL